MAYDREFYRRIEEGALNSARVIVPLVLELLSPRSVVDVGCATGTWLSVFRDLGVRDVVGVDSPEVPRDLLRIAPEQFIAADLAQPLRLAREFDLALSIEVAEHLPPASAAGFVASLVQLAPIVMFSAAIPFQAGAGHINEQWPEYWAERFAEHGYVPADAVREPVWRNPGVKYWHAQNILLFVRAAGLENYPRLRPYVAATDAQRLTRVHRNAYLRVADPHNMSMKELARAAPLVLARFLRGLFSRM